MAISKKDLELLSLYQSSGSDLFFEDIPQNRQSSATSSSITQKKLTQAGSKSNVAHQSLKGQPSTEPGRERSISRVMADSTNSFQELCEVIKKFDGCEIKKAATNTVIYDGQLGAKIMAVGEAPGANEDEQGIPFCGQSGKLLDNIFKSIGLSRKENLFLTNTIFWRPPGNRRPTSEEIDACRPFLEKMVFLLQPKLIIIVGSTAVESLLRIKPLSMNSLRTKNHLYSNCYLSPNTIEATTIFHPSHLLRRPAQKKVMWFDVLKIFKMIKPFINS
ncbi:MAG: uracil-DNA glycosylase [Candidatus Midichloria sp.]|nr:MAG: uracil-DNA glycosylase [Candidatus Midichloria sp.]